MTDTITTVDESGQVLSEVTPSSATSVAEFDPISAGLEELKLAIAGTSYDITTPKGLDQARKLRRACVELRTSAESVYTTLNRPMLDKQKLIRELKTRFITGVSALEDPIDAAIKAQEAEKEKERQAKVAAEAVRVGQIRERLNAIAALPARAVLRDATGIAAMDQALGAIATTEDIFAEFAQEATELKTFVRSQLTELFTAAAAREMEAERVRLESEQLAQQRQADDARNLRLQAIADIKSYPMRAIGQDAETISQLTHALETPTDQQYGDLITLAVATYHETIKQLAQILRERQNADKVVEANRLAEVAASALRQRELAEQAERQRLADEAHDKAQKLLKDQQDAFEAERAQEREALTASKALAAAETLALRQQIAAMQPKPEVVKVINPVVHVVEVLHGLTPEPELVLKPTDPTRPSDANLLLHVARHYDVDLLVATRWLVEFDANLAHLDLDIEVATA